MIFDFAHNADVQNIIMLIKSRNAETQWNPL